MGRDDQDERRLAALRELTGAEVGELAAIAEDTGRRNLSAAAAGARLRDALQPSERVADLAHRLGVGLGPQLLAAVGCQGDLEQLWADMVTPLPEVPLLPPSAQRRLGRDAQNRPVPS
jgi:hypothetical protein